MLAYQFICLPLLVLAALPFFNPLTKPRNPRFASLMKIVAALALVFDLWLLLA